VQRLRACRDVWHANCDDKLVLEVLDHSLRLPFRNGTAPRLHFRGRCGKCDAIHVR
jgi:hypothetical protein